ncbi:GTPase Era, partial [bacterium]|nr:GTPase Era [bacterium]
QTTRNKIAGIKTTDKYQIVFLDTPGIHKPKYKLNEMMVKIAYRALEEVDIVLLMVEPDEEPGGGDIYIIDSLKNLKTPIMLLINKIDLVDKRELLKIIDNYSKLKEFSEIFPISALKGSNIPQLVDCIITYLPTGPKYFPDEMLTDQPERFVIMEIIREKVFHQLKEELPHSTAVIVDDMKEEDGLLRIFGTIYVERDSQKGIMIGKGGSQLKKIGTSARKEMEYIFGVKVYLELHVKVKSKWRQDDSILTRLGIK